jgi:hypothetical protein
MARGMGNTNKDHRIESHISYSPPGWRTRTPQVLTIWKACAMTGHTAQTRSQEGQALRNYRFVSSWTGRGTFGNLYALIW